MKNTTPIYRITCAKTGHKYTLEFQSLLRQLKPTNFDWHEKVMKELSKLEKSGKKATKLNLIFEARVINATEKGVKVVFVSKSVLDLTYTLLLDPQKQDFSGQIGLKIECVLKRVD
jgi:hypothetical protein